ncbi:Reverse transcriptase domain [Arabidopsis suecica]|uniref:Reverse transcriptase domain n=1 Tax=Arabidopsis suecica TaxID=45249 RepID=A0A8T1YR67_ARASU|nr:Reverse transcriptase domain [Arabidopsis suecica]
MAQLALNKGKAAMVRTETVKISGALLSQRIQQFSLTLIGRLLNPSIQRMDSLVTNMPKIWKLEDKVVVADLGKGTFQFNFQSEEDLKGVLQNAPYHFDGWMVVLVRWEPIISSTYPSAINFWVKVSGIPMHLWEEATLEAVGKKVGLIREIDVDSRSFHVTVNGFNPLVFQMVYLVESHCSSGGDFNELRGNHEKRGGKLRHASSFIPFNLMIEDCGLVEFPHLGDWLSWRGWRDKKPIRCRLDRALANEEWHDLFCNSFIEYLPMVASDHSPVVATIADKIPRGKHSFRFDKRWIGKEGLLEAITNGWNLDPGLREGQFVEKLTNCRRAISQWRKELTPFGRKIIEELKSELAVAQRDDTRTREEITDLTIRLKEAYRDEEQYWYQKSRTLWMNFGDNNSKYFHALTKQRRARNRINGLHDENGTWSAEDKDIQNIAVSYFKNLFTTTNPQAFEESLAEVKLRITDQTNEFLTAPATECEVRAALFMMHPEKAPGPDGMTALFFQKAWVTIKTDLLILVNSFLQERVFDKRLNTTNICLIPKTERPTRMTELRPISLCNVGYKVISKILCQRLKKVLPDLISETQSAFVEGRLISDNILIAQEMFHGLRTNPSCKEKYMAIKTDMSKAYDRVEWKCIEELLRKMGFCEKWISWMMWCISTVQYRVLLNGQPRGLIIPERGLRQGDPLSPYLFILCTEVLIANIRKAEHEKLITGIKISTASPSVSHLLFADDSLFFCKANIDQCGVILGILKQYESVSGQQINFSKSSIQFGHKVDDSIKAEIKSVLGINNLGGMGTYLGLPESLGGSKTKIFSFVRERLQTRINGWSAKFLSKGGKEVMIKSVAAALPTYVMSCFRLPKTITSKLTSAVAKFWWSSNGESRGLHWMAWNKLCSSKSDGGLGFRNVDDFNSALLAKQLWRLITVPDSLFAKVFKGRYFRKSNPLDTIKSYPPSYGWRSIMSARSLVIKGLIKRVGSRASISIWEDPWIPAQFPRPAKSNGLIIDPSLKVKNLIDSRSNFWNIDLLNELFVPEDVALISALPLGAPTKEDSLGWHFTKSGKYTVKSGYHTARLEDLEANLSFIGPDFKSLKAHTWKVQCPPKLRHFMWQILSGCVPVTENLRKRGINCDTGCGRCGAIEESINHTLFECHPSRQVWALSQIPTAPEIFPTTSIYANLDHLFWRIPSEVDSSSFPWIIWYILKARNEKIFENVDKDPLEVLHLAEKEAQSWQLAQFELINENRGPSNCETRARERDISHDTIYSGYRCFVDGSWKGTDKFSGTGWFCTSSNGETPTMGAANIRRSLSPLHTEVEALLWAMKCMIGADNQDVAFYTNCSDLVKMVSSPTEWPVFSAYLEEIKSDKEEFSSFSLSLISRSANIRADNLARKVRTEPHHITYVNNIPQEWFF